MRQSSISSDEIDVPTVLKIAADSADGSNDEFDSWMNGAVDRRWSPEGGEDNTISSTGPIDKIMDEERVSVLFLCIFFLFPRSIDNEREMFSFFFADREAT